MHAQKKIVKSWKNTLEVNSPFLNGMDISVVAVLGHRNLWREKIELAVISLIWDLQVVSFYGKRGQGSETAPGSHFFLISQKYKNLQKFDFYKKLTTHHFIFDNPHLQLMPLTEARA